MSEVSIQTSAFVKIYLHAVKYPYCAINGLLLADSTSLKDSSKVQDLEIVDTIPLFHHSHNLTPMAEIALTQVESYAQNNKQTIVGYYAACENFNDNTVEKCPAQKIADKIAEYFPSAVFIVFDNKRLVQHLNYSPLKLYKYTEFKWKLTSNDQIKLKPNALATTAQLAAGGAAQRLSDYDDYLDDLSHHWTNTFLNHLTPTH